ncbi:MAG: hypothetical protein CMK59_12520 [Proteobacteria bacterium]|nr:hypothetical protein [Pseudomonadota bacterium]
MGMTDVGSCAKRLMRTSKGSEQFFESCEWDQFRYNRLIQVIEDNGLCLVNMSVGTENVKAQWFM